MKPRMMVHGANESDYLRDSYRGGAPFIRSTDAAGLDRDDMDGPFTSGPRVLCEPKGLVSGGGTQWFEYWLIPETDALAVAEAEAILAGTAVPKLVRFWPA
ncbi:hypothetical protein ACXDF8_26490 [Mycolicibacterium sp. CBM1]